MRIEISSQMCNIVPIPNTYIYSVYNIYTRIYARIMFYCYINIYVDIGTSLFVSCTNLIYYFILLYIYTYMRYYNIIDR